MHRGEHHRHEALSDSFALANITQASQLSNVVERANRLKLNVYTSLAYFFPSTTSAALR